MRVCVSWEFSSRALWCGPSATVKNSSVCVKVGTRRHASRNALGPCTLSTGRATSDYLRCRQQRHQVLKVTLRCSACNWYRQAAEWDLSQHPKRVTKCLLCCTQAPPRLLPARHIDGLQPRQLSDTPAQNAITAHWADTH